MLDNFSTPDPDSEVATGVKNLIVLALWVPVVLVLWGVGIALAGIGIRIALYGSLPDLAAAGLPVDPTLMGLAVAGGIGYLYLLLANETFGEDTVEAATEQAQDLRDEATEE